MSSEMARPLYMHKKERECKTIGEMFTKCMPQRVLQNISLPAMFTATLETLEAWKCAELIRDQLMTFDQPPPSASTTPTDNAFGQDARVRPSSPNVLERS